jgi:serine/threonine protein kinase
MSLPLGPKDTHATIVCFAVLRLQGTPSHMSPELFMEGHVSKASDVYAYGILLYEIITGRRAYAGVPIPLLPHEVAMQGLRPEWPSNLPEDSLQLRDLAELCWKHHPQDR